MDFVSVDPIKLNVEEITSRITSVACSAVSFVGINIDNFDSQKQIYVEYAADIPSAERIFKDICGQVREKWKVQNIAIFHRLGVIPIQEPCIVVAVSSPDVSNSMQALQYIINVNKGRSPVTRKEVVQVKDEFNCIVDENLLLDQKYIDTESQPLVPSHLIQIKADSKEVNRRINSFIERKREQANIGNIHEFRHYKQPTDVEESCARVDALVFRRKDSKSHLRVRRVFNSWGPLTRPVDLMGQTPLGHQENEDNGSEREESYDIKPLMDMKKTVTFTGVEERLANAEEHLHICGPIPKDVYKRLKRIENRILYLESLSPEYFSLDNVSQKESSSHLGLIEKKRYSQIDLSNKLQELEFKFASKMK